MQLNGRQPTFRRQKPTSNIYRMMIWVSLIVIGFLFSQRVQGGEIKSPFEPTPTPTRTFSSYEMEGITYFQIGKLDCLDPSQPKECAIESFRNAIAIDPNNARLRAELARIMTLSTRMLTTSRERYDRLMEALELVEEAAQLSPDDSYVRGVYAFVLDWLSTARVSSETLTQEQREDYLILASQNALQSMGQDENNAMALAYYAEILVDQQKWNQAEEAILQAVARQDPQNPVMDVHRVYGYVLESLGDYEASVEEYRKALAINPNLTFLYLDIGNKYRFLGTRSANNPSIAKPLIEEALNWFAKAAQINEQLGISDPNPYLAIANTYANQGDFFSAVLNVRKAIRLNPATPEVYAQLGLVYFKSRNYEGSIEAFQCALEGCDETISCQVRQCEYSAGDPRVTITTPLELDDSTYLYYYTYGSVLAALHKPSRPYCEKAVQFLSMVRARYGDNEDIMGIVRAGEEICAASGIQAPGG